MGYIDMCGPNGFSDRFDQKQGIDFSHFCHKLIEYGICSLVLIEDAFIEEPTFHGGAKPPLEWGL